jgi:hypothetical protein
MLTSQKNPNNSLIPKIDFNYWYNKNLIESKKKKKVTAVLTKIVNLYNENKNFEQAYFCGNQTEIDRLKNLNYIELENEIIEKIRNVNDIENISDFEALVIFDLINIWGGLQGGSNFYQIKNKKSVRLGYKEWLSKYKALIKKAVIKDKQAYDYILDGNIPYLGMSFGSKHISFWSRRYGNNKCLIIIDNKIAGCTGAKNASLADYSRIIHEIHILEDELKIEPQILEKALFSFHKNYFDNDNSTFFSKESNRDFETALKVKNILEININKDKKVADKNKARHIKKTSTPSKIISLKKNDFKKSKDNLYYIKDIFFEKNKNIEKYLNKNFYIIDKSNNDKYYKYIGSIENLIFI